LALKEPHAADARIVLMETMLPELSHEDMAVLFPEGFPGWDVEHASIVETSLMLVFRPELVREEEIADGPAQEHPAYDILPPP